MVLPSTESTQTPWPGHRGGSRLSAARSKNETSPLQQAATAATAASPPRLADEQGTPPLSDATFELNNTRDDDVSPDFTLELSDHSATDNLQTKASSPDHFTHPEEARHGRKRPALPFTFGFGMRRPMALAVMMRQPILGQNPPGTAGQAIQDTFDLAATNRLPYNKGSGFDLAA